MDIPGLEVFVPIAPHDAGLALGAMFFERHRRDYKRPPFPLNPYLGPSFSFDIIQKAIEEYDFSILCPEDIHVMVANALAMSKVVGWFQGRSEFGARALGARSVLADPRNPASKTRLNHLLKKRDWFMPYAPSVMVEHGSLFFEDFHANPYMNVAFRVRREVASKIPAAIHVDGTCRAHTVSMELNPSFHNLISRFYEATNIPMILNTSFNRHGIPMIATPKQALQHLAEGAIDALAIDGFFIEAPRRNSYQNVCKDDRFHLDLMALRRAAVLVIENRYKDATSLMTRACIPLGVTPEGFTWNNELIWQKSRTVEDLEEILREITEDNAQNYGGETVHESS